MTVYLLVSIKGNIVSTTAKIFTTGRSQAVRLPQEFRFAEREVYIRRDPSTGDVILSRRPESWDGFLAAIKDSAVPEDFMADRAQGEQARDPLAGLE
ncbi:Virulence-like protein VagC [Cupriavidus necator H16]